MSILFSLALFLTLGADDTTTYVPKRPDDDIRLRSFAGDTLSFWTCADHIFDPFGPMRSVSDIRRTELRGFHLDSLRRGEYIFYKLTNRLRARFGMKPYTE